MATTIQPMKTVQSITWNTTTDLLMFSDSQQNLCPSRNEYDSFEINHVEMKKKK